MRLRFPRIALRENDHADLVYYVFWTYLAINIPHEGDPPIIRQTIIALCVVIAFSYFVWRHSTLTRLTVRIFVPVYVIAVAAVLWKVAAQQVG
jgi:hypothetical protein